jgi:hypothetical protein
LFPTAIALTGFTIFSAGSAAVSLVDALPAHEAALAFEQQEAFALA